MLKLHVSSLVTQFTMLLLRYLYLEISSLATLQKIALWKDEDTLAVCKPLLLVQWVTIISLTRGSQQWFVNTQTKMLPGTLVLYLSNPLSGALFPLTNQNQVELCVQKKDLTNSEETCCIQSANRFSSLRKILFLSSMW